MNNTKDIIEKIYRLYQKPLYAYIVRLVKDPEWAWDILQ